MPGLQDLLDVKRTMGEVIEDSTRAYDARDDAQAKMLALKEKADKELAQHSMEIKVHVHYVTAYYVIHCI